MNAAKLLVEISELNCQMDQSDKNNLAGQVVSEQSSAHPGCLLQLASIELPKNVYYITINAFRNVS